MDLAFFVVNFGYTKEEYQQLTETEKLFIQKEYERKTINDATYMRDAVFNAVSNALRKKGAKFQELFKKKQSKADVEFNESAVDVVLSLEERDGKSWVDKVYAANGLRKPMRGGS
ncbi:phenylalanine racemase [Enterococcus sp. AZ103]|uniref:phenylalanine racemase n=1 Tax=Enterococcus sp. AZ103 TaxID=2774628 RepID=UPI003F24CA2B